jgi:hypothetical protein
MINEPQGIYQKQRRMEINLQADRAIPDWKMSQRSQMQGVVSVLVIIKPK